jgi:RNA polymerase sigma-70 factor (ECF subfamily)
MTTAPEDQDDEALLRAFREGDDDAFGVLFRRHRDRLWAVALRTTGNPEDAADALQEAMIAAFRRADSFRGDAAVTTWLHRIVVNASLDRLRRNKVRAADPLPDDLDEYAARGKVLDAPEGDDGPEEQALAGDRRNNVLAALDQLPPDQKAALVLVDMEGYAVQEAAEILECPTGTVKSRCARGRARLAALLRPASSEPADGSGTGSVRRASDRAEGPPGPSTGRTEQRSRGGAPA